MQQATLGEQVLNESSALLVAGFDSLRSSSWCAYALCRLVFSSSRTRDHHATCQVNQSPILTSRLQDAKRDMSRGLKRGRRLSLCFGVRLDTDMTASLVGWVQGLPGNTSGSGFVGSSGDLERRAHLTVQQ